MSSPGLPNLSSPGSYSHNPAANGGAAPPCHNGKTQAISRLHTASMPPLPMVFVFFLPLLLI